MTPILLDRTIKGSHFLRETAKWDCLFTRTPSVIHNWDARGPIYRVDVLHVNADWKKKKQERKIYTKN